MNYYLDGTEQKVADSETKSAPWGTQVKASDLAKDIDGYTAVPNQDATITVDLNGNNSINVYYYQNVSLKANSAEVTYNGKDQSVLALPVRPKVLISPTLPLAHTAPMQVRTMLNLQTAPLVPLTKPRNISL